MPRFGRREHLEPERKSATAKFVNWMPLRASRSQDRQAYFLKRTSGSSAGERSD